MKPAMPYTESSQRKNSQSARPGVRHAIWNRCGGLGDRVTRSLERDRLAAEHVGKSGCVWNPEGKPKRELGIDIHYGPIVSGDRAVDRFHPRVRKSSSVLIIKVKGPGGRTDRNIDRGHHQVEGPRIGRALSKLSIEDRGCLSTDREREQESRQRGCFFHAFAFGLAESVAQKDRKTQGFIELP